MLTLEQESARRGKLTASMAAVIMGGPNTKGLSEYCRRLAGERLYGDLGEPSFKSWQMERGSELEAAALDFYEFQSGETIERGVVVDHPTIPNVAATPDAIVLVGSKRVRTVEAKSPTFHVWCEIREDWQKGERGLDCVPSEYRWQARWQPWVVGVTQGVFVAYHPAGGGQAVIVPYEITQADCDLMAARVITVEAMIRNWLDILRG